MSQHKNHLICAFLCSACITSTTDAARSAVSTPPKPTVQLIQEAGTNSNTLAEKLQSQRTFSAILECDECRITQVTLSWSVEAEVSTIELNHVENDESRTNIKTIESSQGSSNTTTIKHSIDFRREGRTCFDIVTTFMDGTTTTSEDTCFTLS
jgi:hypothetical protein